MQKNYKVIIVGYGGHSHVVIESLLDLGIELYGYLDKIEKKNNPFGLTFLGDENNFLDQKKSHNYNYIITVGDNKIRNKISKKFLSKKINLINIIDPSALLSKNISIGNGNFISKNVVINYGVKLKNYIIINSSSIIEHHSTINSGVHIGPGAIILGNVTVGRGSLIGANCTIKEGVKIGKNVIIGAGSVIIKDIEDGKKVVGNPSREI